MLAQDYFKVAKKVFVIGGYGSKNIGDEAILAGIIETIRKDNLDVGITVLAHNAKEVEDMHGVDSVGMSSLFPTIFQHDTIVIGGGTIFRPNMRLRAQLMPLIALLLRVLRKKIMFYSLGIDSRTSKLARFLLVPIMNLSQFVSVRDLVSLEVLKTWGVKNKIEIVPDPAIGLSYKKLSDEDLVSLGLDLSKPTIGLSLRNLQRMDDLDFIGSVVSFLDKRISEGYQVLYLPMCQSPISDFENDLMIGKKIESLLNDKSSYSILVENLHPSKLKSLYARLDLVIGMRLHAMILSISTKTSLIGITYAQKCRSYLDSNNEDYLELDNVTEDSLAAFFSKRVDKN